MREGCSIMFSQVNVDTSIIELEIPSDKPDEPPKKVRKIAALANKEIYEIASDQFGLSKTVLQKIQTAAGISWDPEASYRADNGSEPFYCEYVAVGSYYQFDGTPQTLMGRKEVDLRDGSALCREAHEKAEASARAYVSKWRKWGNESDEAFEERKRAKIRDAHERAEKNIRQARIHIVSLTETKAQLRAIRSLGIKTSYSLRELEKPFVIARLAFTGQSDDPELRRLFAEGTMNYMLRGRAALFGGRRSDQRRQLGPAAGAPPPIAESHDGGGVGEEVLHEFIEGDLSETETDLSETSNAAAQPTADTTAPSYPRPVPDSNVMKVPFGECAGMQINDPQVPEARLAALVDWYMNEIEDTEKAPFKTQNQRDLAVILREIDNRRASRGAQPIGEPESERRPATQQTSTQKKGKLF